MKKLLLVALVGLGIMSGLTGCGQATRTTEIWEYDEEQEDYVLTETREEEIDGMFSERSVIRIEECNVYEYDDTIQFGTVLSIEDD